MIAFYLSPGHREEKMDGCPVVALGSDAASQGADVKASFEAGIKSYLEARQPNGRRGEWQRPKARAMAILSTMVGAVTLSRVVNDPDLAQAFLDAGAQQVRESVALKEKGRGRRR